MQGRMFLDMKNKLTDRIDEITTDSVLSELMESYIFEGAAPFNLYEVMIKIEPSEAVLVKDVTNLIAVFVIRGTNFGKFVQRMKGKGKQTFEELKEKYKLVNVAAQSAITPNRILSSFPYIVAKIRKMLKLPLVGKNIINPAYASPSAASLMLTDSDFKTWLNWFKSFLAIVVNDKSRVTKALEIAHIAYKNIAVFDIDYRKNAVGKVGLLLEGVSAQDLTNLFLKEEEEFEQGGDDDKSEKSSTTGKKKSRGMMSSITSKILGTSNKSNFD